MVYFDSKVTHCYSEAIPWKEIYGYERCNSSTTVTTCPARCWLDCHLCRLSPYRLWPTGWAWHEGQSEYLTMIIGIYATLGIFLLIASRDPFAHLSLIWFTIWSSLVH